MPIFFQQRINDSTRLGIWKIEETEDFFLNNVPQHRDVTHPHKRLQHLAGRFLLQFLFPGFPYELVQIADTRKPFLPNEQFHFSISHCGDYAAAIVSNESRVGIDIEIPVEKLGRIKEKFLAGPELELADARLPASKDGSSSAGSVSSLYGDLTLLWSVKEAIFKWYGDGGVDFRQDIQIRHLDHGGQLVDVYFKKTTTNLQVDYRRFDSLVLAWLIH